MKKTNNKFISFLLGNRSIITIVLVSLLLSLFWSFFFQIRPAVDARAYDNIAWNLVEGNGFWENSEGDLMRDTAIVRIGPLYQYFLAGHYYFFGHNYEAVWVSQAILHALTALLVYLICLLVFKDNKYKKKIGIFASLIVGFYPDLIEISAMLLMETFYLFLFCLALYLFFRFFNKITIWSTIVLGLFFGLGTLTRPPILFLTPIIFYYYINKKKLLASILFTICLLAVFVPWTMRNYSVYDKFLPFGVGGAYNFWIGNQHGGTGEQEQPKEANAFMETYGVVEIQEYSLNKFKSFLVEHPFEFIKLSLIRTNRYFSIAHPIGFWFYQSGMNQFIFLLSSGLASVILFIFGLAGLVKSFKLKNKQLNYLIAFTIVTPLILFATVVETRYRFQIYPLLAIFAGYFIVYLMEQKKIWSNKMLWISTLIVVVNGILALLVDSEKFIEKLNLFF